LYITAAAKQKQTITSQMAIIW